MNSLDFAILAIVLFSVLIGIYRGFIRETLSFANWFVAGLFAWLFSEPVSEILEKDIVEPNLRLLATFVVLFIVAYIIGSAITYVIHKIMTARPFLKTTNAILGAVVGGIRGVLIIIFAFLLAGLSETVPRTGWWKDSEFAPVFQNATLFTADLLPEDIARHIRYD